VNTKYEITSFDLKVMKLTQIQGHIYRQVNQILIFLIIEGKEQNTGK
jgi:hypothetical protein